MRRVGGEGEGDRRFLVRANPGRPLLLSWFARVRVPFENVRGEPMYSFNLKAEQVFDPKKHMEKVLGRTGEGDVTVACWEPGQTSPYHCHPDATEIYFCFEGGGKMRTPSETIDIAPGSFVVHPRGELHEYINGPQRTLLFRVRYGEGMSGRTKEWPTNTNWQPRPEDLEYFGRD
jgi:quercetin dioxygenase-like cupin family protein